MADTNADDDPRVGLCARCTFTRRIVSSRGSTFYRCELSSVDVRFPRYPPLPVVVCAGFTPTDRHDRVDPLRRT
jgi:hypothetical protein